VHLPEMIGMIGISIWRDGENLHLDLRVKWTCRRKII